MNVPTNKDCWGDGISNYSKTPTYQNTDCVVMVNKSNSLASPNSQKGAGGVKAYFFLVVMGAVEGSVRWWSGDHFSLLSSLYGVYIVISVLFLLGLIYKNK